MTAPERIWARPSVNMEDEALPYGEWHVEPSPRWVSYILATPESLAASPEVQALIAAAEIDLLTGIEMEWRSYPSLDAARRNLRSRIETIRTPKKGE